MFRPLGGRAGPGGSGDGSGASSGAASAAGAGLLSPAGRRASWEESDRGVTDSPLGGAAVAVAGAGGSIAAAAAAAAMAAAAAAAANGGGGGGGGGGVAPVAAALSQQQIHEIQQQQLRQWTSVACPPGALPPADATRSNVAPPPPPLPPFAPFAPCAAAPAGSGSALAGPPPGWHESYAVSSVLVAHVHNLRRATRKLDPEDELLAYHRVTAALDQALSPDRDTIWKVARYEVRDAAVAGL
jgi:hypothetical protein